MYCADCFENSEHRGHRFEVKEQKGGLCCCGDESALAVAGFCKKHSGSMTILPKVSQEKRQRFMKYMCTLS